MITIEITLLGALKQLDDMVTLHVESGTSVGSIKQSIKQHLESRHAHSPVLNLIEDSALANESEILSHDDLLTTDQKLAILPPVCGG